MALQQLSAIPEPQHRPKLWMRYSTRQTTNHRPPERGTGQGRLQGNEHGLRWGPPARKQNLYGGARGQDMLEGRGTGILELGQGNDGGWQSQRSDNKVESGASQDANPCPRKKQESQVAEEALPCKPLKHQIAPSFLGEGTIGESSASVQAHGQEWLTTIFILSSI